MKKKAIVIGVIILFLCGLLIFLLPTLTDTYYSFKNQQTITSFKKTYTKSENSTVAQNDKLDDNLYQQMLQYNTQLFQNQQQAIQDPFAFTESDFNLSDFGIKDQLVGYIQIPRMDIELPIYLGASEQHMEKGIAQLGQTSFPIGGSHTNTVLAGHRGAKYQKMFRDIEQLQQNDILYVTNFWETLSYEVEAVKIVEPSQINEVFIQENRDMLTLMTCHPYPTSEVRYLVYCKRIETPTSKVEIQKQRTWSQSTSKTSTILHVENNIRTYISYALLIIFMLLTIRLIHRKRKNKKQSTYT